MRHAGVLLIVMLASVAGLPAQAPTEQSALAFEIASVRRNTGSDLSIPFGPVPPDGIAIVNRPLESIIRFAYNLEQFRILGIPGWAREERFDITAKAPRPITDGERRLMMRSLLAERFRLNARVEQREQTVYVMTRARPGHLLGPGLRPRLDCTGATKCAAGGSAFPDAGRVTLKAVTLDGLAGMLASILGGVVRNESNTEGAFDIELSWRPDLSAANSDPNDARPSFFTAVEEQLGFTLESARRPVDVLVIESLERPTRD